MAGLPPTTEYAGTSENTSAGIRQAISLLKKHQPQRVTIEATGRLELPFVAVCHKANLPIVVANPLHNRRFAQATGRAAKTDRLDAESIAHFGEALRPRPKPPKNKNAA